MVLVLFRSVLETREKMIFYLLFNPDLLCHIYCETISILHSYEIDRIKNPYSLMGIIIISYNQFELVCVGQDWTW